MLAFHNEHIASCAFLTYFSPESSTTAANSPTSAATQATLYNDKQALTGITTYPYGASLSMRRMHRWHRPAYSGVPYTRATATAAAAAAAASGLGMQHQRQHHQHYYQQQQHLSHHHHHHRQQQQTQQQQQSTPNATATATATGLIVQSRSNLREICKTQAIC